MVEDNFVAGRPAWEVAGVQMVNDVLPWEEMKLRMLNGSHSFLAIWVTFQDSPISVIACRIAHFAMPPEH
ncbi:hypothetical protein ACVXG9_28320 [Escherichia coli]